MFRYVFSKFYFLLVNAFCSFTASKLTLFRLTKYLPDKINSGILSVVLIAHYLLQ